MWGETEGKRKTEGIWGQKWLTRTVWARHKGSPGRGRPWPCEIILYPNLSVPNQPLLDNSRPRPECSWQFRYFVYLHCRIAALVISVELRCTPLDRGPLSSGQLHRWLSGARMVSFQDLVDVTYMLWRESETILSFFFSGSPAHSWSNEGYNTQAQGEPDCSMQFHRVSATQDQVSPDATSSSPCRYNMPNTVSRIAVG